jgi:lipoprotein-anchoring transpeptidase ErfK/SrfK
MKLLSGGRLALAAALLMSVLAMAPARADVMVRIDKSSQRMSVSVDGAPRYSWPVSTGRSGYGTPSGVFHPQMMARRWFSKRYYNSPMPHSIFFYYGFAIHGTYDIHRLGGPASHGCVRLDPSHAATLYALVERNGRGSTRIVISN